MTSTSNSTPPAPKIHLGDLLRLEREYLVHKRKQLGRSEIIEEDSFAIALSGGGIRSATICLGIVSELNKRGFLAEADYLSTVSGGGYLGAYIQSELNSKTAEEEPPDFARLFNEDIINHFRNYREYLYVWNGKNGQRFASNLLLFLVALKSTVLNWLWLLLPLLYLCLPKFPIMMPEMHWGWQLLIAVLLMWLIGSLLPPNITSPHRYYKRRLSKAYLPYNKGLKLWQLTNIHAPYPLINATINVNYDKYDKMDKVSYRGPIKSNYFLFSPKFCGSQVTGYIASDSPVYRSISLATAMATSAAAVNTFMGNFRLPFVVRQLMALLNLRTGILAPNPQLQKKRPTFWPYYTLLEILGNSDTTTNHIQVSDGGHVENLGVYELLRRQVKVIIAIDAGEDEDFSFSDLKNLVTRSRSELGIVISFADSAKPQEVIKPDVTDGFSKKDFVVAKLSGMKGSYAKNYDGVLIYVKSSVLANKEFRMRRLKNKTKRLVNEGKRAEVEQAKRDLDSYMYRTYNPEFPHESTADQFFDEAQWDAYYDLGIEIGNHLCEELDLQEGDTGKELFAKGDKYFTAYT